MVFQVVEVYRANLNNWRNINFRMGEDEELHVFMGSNYVDEAELKNFSQVNAN